MVRSNPAYRAPDRGLVVSREHRLPDMLLTPLFRKLLLGAIATVVVLSKVAQSSAASADLASLDILVSQQRYHEALSALDASRLPKSDKVAWLRRQAEHGHVPIMYALSVRLFGEDVNESLKWYARGRLARTLDAAECADQTASLGWRVSLDQQARGVADAGVANARAFSAAIDDALLWDDQRKERPSATWICASASADQEAGLLPQPKRDSERADTRETMAINARAIADFYMAVDAGVEAKFRRLESHIDVPRIPYRSRAGWLDNRRLLFVGVKRDEANRENEAPVFPELYLWDTDENRITLLRTARAIFDLCVDRSHVSYLYATVDAQKANRLASGRFPDLIERETTGEESRRLFMRPDCERAPDLPNENIFATTWLRTEHGYLYRENGVVTLHRPDGTTTRVDVGVDNNTSPGVYAPFRDSYLVRGGYRDRHGHEIKLSSNAKPGDGAVLFWLRPNGETTAVDIPYGVWDSPGPFKYYPSAMGVLLPGGRSSNDNFPGFTGLYLFEDGGLTRRLAAGPSSVLAISPNGCRVAYANAPTPAAARHGITMNYINLCHRQ